MYCDSIRPFFPIQGALSLEKLTLDIYEERCKYKITSACSSKKPAFGRWACIMTVLRRAGSVLLILLLLLLFHRMHTHTHT